MARTYPRNRAKNLACAIAARQRTRAVVAAHLAKNPCVDCGESDPVVLDFDHREPATKFKQVCDMLTYSAARLLAEIAKCDVRCANCHRRRTARQRAAGEIRQRYPARTPEGETAACAR